MATPEPPDISPQQAVVLLAFACEQWRLAFGDQLPPEGDTSPQATEKRLELFDQVRGLCLRHRFSGTVTAAQRRAALGHQVRDLDLDASQIEPGHPLPRVRSLRQATHSEEASLVPLRSALAEAAGFPIHDEEEEGGVA